MSSKTDRRAAQRAQRSRKRKHRREASRRPGHNRAFPFQHTSRSEATTEQMQRLFLGLGT